MAENNAHFARAARRGFKMRKIKTKIKPRIMVDLLSSLPNDVRSKILSLLPIEQAIRTSLLSQDWKDVWEFSDQLRITEIGFLRMTRRQDYMDQFWLRFRSLKLDAFSFSFTRAAGVYRDQVTRLLLFAINRAPKIVSLNFSVPTDLRRPFYPLPDAFYDQPLLETLSLASCIFDTDKFRNFTSLKSLSLGHVSLGENGVLLDRILRGCETIEALTLRRVCVGSDSHITIRSTKLKSLTIEDCRIFGIEFYTPSLTFFKYKGKLLDIENLTFDRIFVFHTEIIREMHLNFVGTPCCGRKTVGDLTRRHLSLLRGEMRFLKVCSFTLQSLWKSRYVGLSLNIGIEELTIETSFHGQEFEGLLVLLRGCLRLQRLTIIIVGEENVCTTNYTPMHEINRELDLYCVKHFLEKVYVHGYKGSKRENDFLKYLIEEGKNMQKLLIRSHPKRVHRKRAHRLQDIERRSPYLRIIVK